MIKRGSQLPTIAMKFEHPKFAGVSCVQVQADSQTVVVAYLSMVGNILDAQELSVKDNPELKDIVKFTYFDDVWDMDMVLSIIEPVETDELACDPAPKWHFKQWQPETEPDFRNLPTGYTQVAS